MEPTLHFLFLKKDEKKKRCTFFFLSLSLSKLKQHVPSNALYAKPF